MKIFPDKANKIQFITGDCFSQPQKGKAIPPRRDAHQTAKFVVLPIPYERTTSYGKGAKKGPDAILKASLQLELWDEEIKKEPWKDGVYTFKSFNCDKSEKLFFKTLETKVEHILNSTDSIPFFLGGEHSITQALVPPFLKKHKNLSVLHFDAHADLRPEYEGSVHNHACALHPISKICKVVQVGIRNVATEEEKYTNSGNVKTYLMHENLNIDKLSSKVLRNLTSKVYITIDADGFDPSVMPATGTPQPGGFMWYNALRFFKKICERKEIVGVDMVEVSPIKNFSITEFAAAKLIYRIMGYLSVKKR
ncbi:MAG: agmatinase [Elusimicrobia bacterium]|nr:agmatinase [Elusimicrobiota bacterium]